MIIQCEQCRTKFKLDDSKVPDKGVKVRCVKCKHVFSVAKEQPAAAPLADFGSVLDSTVSVGQEMVEAENEYTAPEEVSAIEFEDSEDFADSTAEIRQEPDADAFDVDEQPLSTPFVESPTPPVEEETMFAPVQAAAEDTSDDIDFGAFAFGEDEDSGEPVEEATPTFDFGDTPKAAAPRQETKKSDFGGLDFSGDDMFGEVVPSTPEESDTAISFDFGMDGFASSMGVEDAPAGQTDAFAISESSDSPFSLDEIDFGDEFTSVGVQHVSPDELKPSQELLFAPLAEAQVKPASAAAPALPGPEEELPPLSIASRRKQSTGFNGFVAVLGVIIAGAVAFLVYSMFSGEKSNMAEIGHISVRQVDATFVKNKLTGDLLVISGEAVNEFSKPRAAIQVKGMVFGADGEVISSKNAFCGNPLTEEQLSTMPMDKIEAAMANQFGDSLANMEVAPGKAIPFVIVISKPAAGAKDYGVEPAGSTVATGKQQ